MHRVKKEILLKCKKLFFLIYLFIVIFSISLSIMSNFINMNLVILSTFSALIIYVFGGIKESLIENYLFDVQKVPPERIAGLKKMFMALPNISLVITVFSCLRQEFNSGNYITQLTISLLVIFLSAILKWLLKFLEGTLGVDTMFIHNQINLKEDKVIEIIFSSTDRVSMTDDFLWFLSNLNDEEQTSQINRYYGVRKEKDLYEIELRVTSKNYRYYLIKENLKLSPTNFNFDDYENIIKNGKKLKFSIPMFGPDSWPLLEQEHEEKLFKTALISAKKSFLDIVRSFYFK